MTESMPDNTVQAFKQRAKRLRTALEEKNITLNHGQCLDLVARMEGVRDWNTLSAQAESTTGQRQNGSNCAWHLGQAVTGKVYGRPFAARIVGLRNRAKPGLVHMDVEFDTRTNVSGLESMEDWRHRKTVTLDEQGRAVDAIGRVQGDFVLDK